ncbi:MAG: segregation/condensation protein A, partial [bacterium]|nr:segregation/condensation protein A [bacterium]
MTEAINYESMMQMNLDFASVNPTSQEMDAVEILVSMAKTGKINPWSVDIVDITDKYLAHMFKMKAQNLKVTGRTLLFAAILLRLKSNILEGVDISEFEQNDMEDEFFDDEFQADYDLDDEINTNNVISIDEVLQRRTSVRMNRNRVVTLKDLI